jgi:hypothetical protein
MDFQWLCCPVRQTKEKENNGLVFASHIQMCRKARTSRSKVRVNICTWVVLILSVIFPTTCAFELMKKFDTSTQQKMLVGKGESTTLRGCSICHTAMSHKHPPVEASCKHPYHRHCIMDLALQQFPHALRCPVCNC